MNNYEKTKKETAEVTTANRFGLILFERHFSNILSHFIQPDTLLLANQLVQFHSRIKLNI